MILSEYLCGYIRYEALLFFNLKRTDSVVLIMKNHANLLAEINREIKKRKNIVYCIKSLLKIDVNECGYNTNSSYFFGWLICTRKFR